MESASKRFGHLLGQRVQVESAAGLHIGQLTHCDRYSDEVQVKTILAPLGYWHLSSVSSVEPVR